MQKILLLMLLSISALAMHPSHADERLTPEQKDKLDTALAQRFASADVNSDGQVTRDEAKGLMPRVYKHFERIDADHNGAVTLEGIRQALKLLSTLK